MIRNEIFSEIDQQELIHLDNFMVTDSSADFYYNGFEQSEGQISYYGNYCFEGALKEYNTIYWDSIPSLGKDTTFIVSFWLGNARKDLVPRSTIEFAFTDSTGQFINVEYNNLGDLYELLDGDWALLENSLLKHSPGTKVKITIWNKNLRKEKLIIDEFLIRPLSLNIYQEIEGGIWKNNRIYLSQ